MEILEHVALKDCLAGHIGDEAQLQKCLHYVFHSGQVMWAHVQKNSRLKNTNHAFRRILGLPEEFHGISLYDYIEPVNENTMLCGGFGDQPGLPTIFHSKHLSQDLLFMVYDYDDGYILLGQVNQPDADSQSALIADITTELALLVREMKYMNRDLKQAKQHISDINQVDELTGLANRRYFHQRFKEDLAYANRYITPITLVSFDLDNYKKVKERYGQRLADAILKQIGIILNSHCRSSDLAAHYVNDEFCIVLPHTTLIAGVQFAERIRMAIIKCRLEREQMLQLTASFGVVENHNNPSIHSLLNLADKALYQAKKTGKNKVCVYS